MAIRFYCTFRPRGGFRLTEGRALTWRSNHSQQAGWMARSQDLIRLEGSHDRRKLQTSIMRSFTWEAYPIGGNRRQNIRAPSAPVDHGRACSHFHDDAVKISRRYQRNRFHEIGSTLMALGEALWLPSVIKWRLDWRKDSRPGPLAIAAKSVSVKCQPVDGSATSSMHPSRTWSEVELTMIEQVGNKEYQWAYLVDCEM